MKYRRPGSMRSEKLRPDRMRKKVGLHREAQWRLLGGLGNGPVSTGRCTRTIANPARRKQKDQLHAAHTIPPSHSGHQASERHPCCHKGYGAAFLLWNLPERASMQRHWCQLCVSETSSSAPSIGARWIRLACYRSCDCAFCASHPGSSRSTQTLRAELALASSGMTTPFPCAIVFAYDNCAGLTGLVASVPAVSPLAFLGTC